MKRRTTIMLAVLAFVLCGCGKADEAATNNASVTPAASVTTTAAPAEKTETVTVTETAAQDTDNGAANENPEAQAEADSDSMITANAKEADQDNADIGGASLVTGDLFAGYYCNEADRSVSMSIDNLNDTTYRVNISRRVSDSEIIEWYFTGSFDGTQTLSYDSCVKSITTCGTDGSINCTQEYTDGTGTLRITEGNTMSGIVWHDDKENTDSGLFVIQE